jgi:hypothetical protein
MIAEAPVVTNLVFALAQLGIGIGLLWRRTSRFALAASIGWSLGVWYMGEGLGGLASGHASLITGFPGAVMLYAVVALAAWTGRDPRNTRRPPSPYVLGAWLAVWAFGGIFQALPGQGGVRQLASTIAGSSNGSPSWLAALDRLTASWIGDAGRAGLVIVIAFEVSVGIAALASRPTARVAAVLGGLGALGIWAVGESFGQIYSGGHRPQQWAAAGPPRGFCLLQCEFPRDLVALGGTHALRFQVSDPRPERSSPFGYVRGGAGRILPLLRFGQVQHVIWHFR